MTVPQMRVCSLHGEQIAHLIPELGGSRGGARVHQSLLLLLLLLKRRRVRRLESVLPVDQSARGTLLVLLLGESKGYPPVGCRGHLPGGWVLWSCQLGSTLPGGFAVLYKELLCLNLEVLPGLVV